MSSNVDDQRLLGSGTIPEPRKKCKILYSRDFLLSLSDCDVCKKLPIGFDGSILSEFYDASQNVQERQRIPSSFSSQSFRRNEYGSSSPIRGESSNYSRGVQGKWAIHAGGRSDRDSDSQSDWDSDSGKHGNQSRQNSEQHDGLLGRGSFPRTAGYATGSGAPKFGANDQHRSNRSNEPYLPPRPYKAVPHSLRDTKDSYNAETFGSFECPSQDSAEEERRRRASFELMRREQKELQEKQKLNPNQHKEKSVSDISALTENSYDSKQFLRGDSVMVNSVMESVPHYVPGKPFFSSQAPKARPLVPPGFTSTVVEKKFGTNSLSEEDGGNLQHEDISLIAKDNPTLNGFSVSQVEKHSTQNMSFGWKQLETTNGPVQLVVNERNIVNSSSALEVFNELTRINNSLYKTLNVLDTCKSLEDSDTVKLDTDKVTEYEVMGETIQEQSRTILEKLFCTASAINGSGSRSLIEHHQSKEDDIWSHNTIQSSKFAHWFLEEEKTLADDNSSGRSSDLLSLIAGGEKGGSKQSDVKSKEQFLPGFSFTSSELNYSHIASDVSISTSEISEQLCSSNKSQAIPAVLTCEDLEQSMLSEISENSSSMQGCILAPKTEQPKAANDDHASRHLLSLLQKGPVLQDTELSPNPDMVSSDKPCILETEYETTEFKNHKEENAGKIHCSGNTLTLETLFGSAFMKELQDSVGSARIDIEEPYKMSSVVDDGVFLPKTDRIGPNKSGHEGSVLTSNRQAELGNTKGHWLCLDNPQHEMHLMHLQTELGAKSSGFDTEIHLPEEESLLTIVDTVNPSAIDISGKLAALNVGQPKDDPMTAGQEDPPFLPSHHHLMDPEIPHQNLHPRSYSPHFRSQVKHGRLLLHPFDSHPIPFNTQLKFMPPESSIAHNAQAHHQLPRNILCPQFQHLNSTFSSYDPSSHQPMLQRMHMPDNIPPPHSMREFPRATPLPQPSNHSTGIMQDATMMHDFRFGHQNLNPKFVSPGMHLLAPNVSGGHHHPEALQRLFDMEVRLNPKQLRPFTIAGGHAREMYGH